MTKAKWIKIVLTNVAIKIIVAIVFRACYEVLRG